MQTGDNMLAGWIKPDGTACVCEPFESHLDAAKRAGEMHPDDAGWLHVCWEGYLVEEDGPVACVPAVTQAQLEALWSMYCAHKHPLPEWLVDVTVVDGPADLMRY